LQAMSELLSKDVICEQLRLTPSMGKLRAIFYQNNVVIAETLRESGDSLLKVRMPRIDYLRILRDCKINPTQLTEIN
jgi:GTPase